MVSGEGSIEDVSVAKPSGWIRLAASLEGCERIEAFFAGKAYEPHRHDTYAIGRTLSGVQRFRYRGGVVNGVPGTTLVIHPDEVHDGQAGTADGFHYRMIYLEPALIQGALGGRPLPFVQAGLSTDPRLARATDAFLDGMSRPMETLEYHDVLFDLAHALEAAASQCKRRSRIIDYRSVERARSLIDASLNTTLTLDMLEASVGRDRWSLSRDFRLAFGTSPYRYLTMRRLDKAKAHIRQGQPLVQVALESGFADQAHMTRQFRRAFGITPSSWRRLIKS